MGTYLEQGYLPRMRGTYPGWGAPTLDRGYLPWTGVVWVPTQGRYPSVNWKVDALPLISRKEGRYPSPWYEQTDTRENSTFSHPSDAGGKDKRNVVIV